MSHGKKLALEDLVLRCDVCATTGDLMRWEKGMMICRACHASGKREAPVDDPVNHPSHYTSGGIECIDAIKAALGLEGFAAFCRGAVIKYSWRAPLKGAAAQDMRKTAKYAIWAAEAFEEIGEKP